MLNRKSIVLIEYDKVDIMVFKKCLKDLEINNPLLIFKNGEEFFNSPKEFFVNSIGIIFLDLNTPKFNGFDFLKKIQLEQKYYTIPIIIVSTSKDENDVMQAYQSGARGYIHKCSNNKIFAKSLKITFDYWDTQVLL